MCIRDRREFIRDELDSCLFSVLFNQQGRAFAGYYYGEGDSPYYPADVDDNALRFFGPEPVSYTHLDVYKRQNRNYHVKAEDVKHLLPDWEGADGCIATNRITVEGCKIGYCYREKPDGGLSLIHI